MIKKMYLKPFFVWTKYGNLCQVFIAFYIIIREVYPGEQVKENSAFYKGGQNWSRAGPDWLQVGSLI